MVEVIAKFFYFTLTQESKILEASAKALHIYEKKLNLVSALNQVWKSYKKDRLVEARSGVEIEIFSEVSLDPWSQFKKLATEDELLVTSMSIVGLSLNEMAQGLDLSEGIVTFRLNRAMGKLGELLENGI